MKAVSLDIPRSPKYRELDELVLEKDDWVKVRVKAVGLCGSDLQKIFSEKNPSSYLGSSILGHEFSGLIEEIGSNVKNIGIGDKVTAIPLISCYSCDPCKNGKNQLCTYLQSIGRDLPGAFADYVLVPSENVRKVSNRLDYETAALTDLSAVGVHCYTLSDSPRNENILIYGDGSLALTCLQIFYRKGNKVNVIGKHKKNLEVAESFGATSVEISDVSNIKSNTFDCIIETIGRKQDTTICDSIRFVKPGGKIIVSGVFEKGYTGKIPFRDLFYKEARLVGSNSYDCCCENNEFDVALGMLEQGEIDYSPIITNMLPLEKFNEGIDLIKRKRETGAIKIIYRP